MPRPQRSSTGESKGELTRRRIVHAAMGMFQRQGYVATGLAEIVEAADAPKGSFYFHFPGGKSELAVAAVREASALMVALFESIAARADDTSEVVTALADALAASLRRSAFVAGCPISTVALETTPGDEELSDAIAAEFGRWREVLVGRFVTDGLARERAMSLATVVVSGLEGALIMSRAERSTEALEQAATELAGLVRLSTEQGEVR